MRRKKYTPQGLKAACRRYFAMISRTVPVTQMIDSGQRDDKGHSIMIPVEVKNDAGDVIMRKEFLIPPTISGLCRYLDITRETWLNYCDNEEFDDVTVRVRERMREWNEEQLLTRDGKDVRGIIFNLQNNYGYVEKREMEIGSKAAGAIQTAAMSMSEKAELLEKLKREAFGGESIEDT